MSDPVPHFKYRAIVRGHTVYAGDDEALAMRTFETFADGEAIALGAGMVVYVMPPFAISHTVPGQEGRPVIEAHAMDTGRHFVGALYGVPHETWRSRERQP